MCFVTTLTTQTGGTNNNKFRFYTKNFNNYDLINKGEITLLILNNYPNYYLNQLFFYFLSQLFKFFYKPKSMVDKQAKQYIIETWFKNFKSFKNIF